MSEGISRRRFFNLSLGAGAGALLAGKMPALSQSKPASIPLIITSHTNDRGKEALKAGWEILVKGGTALDAVEKAANIIELDPEGMGVGYGGLPNEHGVVQLDASIMDGKTYNAGAVACLENIKTPSSVARVVMERTDHVMLVGKDALEFAKKWGFKEEDLLTEKSRKAWLIWKESMSDRDDWGPPDHLKQLLKKKTSTKEPQDVEYKQGTTNVLAVDMNGDIAGITSTSGLSYKIPGRVGDSPIIGAGLYVDNDVGAAGATGRGEEVIKSCTSYYMVMRMKEGRTPQQACEDAINMIVDRYKRIGSGYVPGVSFRAINKQGDLGCSRMNRDQPGRMSVMTEKGYSIFEGSLLFPSKERDQ